MSCFCTQRHHVYWICHIDDAARTNVINAAEVHRCILQQAAQGGGGGEGGPFVGS